MERPQWRYTGVVKIDVRWINPRIIANRIRSRVGHSLDLRANFRHDVHKSRVARIFFLGESINAGDQLDVTLTNHPRTIQERYERERESDRYRGDFERRPAPKLSRLRISANRVARREREKFEFRVRRNVRANVIARIPLRRWYQYRIRCWPYQRLRRAT